jgi:hypothetical protein
MDLTADIPTFVLRSGPLVEAAENPNVLAPWGPGGPGATEADVPMGAPLPVIDLTDLARLAAWPAGSFTRR